MSWIASDMTLTHPTVNAYDDLALDRLERRIERLAITMDAAIRIPGTRIRFGADSLIGLVPGVGDFAGAGVSAYLIWEARRLGLPGSVISRMVANAAVDAFIGSVPLVGDVFDLFYKANMRNVLLMRREIARIRAARSADPLRGRGR